ncbi:MAG TPA: PIN domain-containing protein [Terriglobia bacterium]|nr:PIN domain-containing protein [Terriglobia bacterium]
MKGIADTGFIVAFGNRNDRYHAWALEIAKGITEPLLTCEAVLAEAAFHLASGSYVLSLFNDEMLRLAFDFPKNLEQLARLAERYQDRHPDLADLCLIRMSEIYPRHVVVTIDESDFRVYRRNKRETIPLLCPSQRRGG